MKYKIWTILFVFLSIKMKALKQCFVQAHPVLNRLKGNKGVLIVEYVLLVFCCVTIGFLIQKAFDIGAGESDSGWIINQWIKILKIIAEDT